MAISIAVIIPTFNGSRFVAKAIESVLGQTRPADEIIVVDDGSTDDTKTVVRGYPVKLIEQENAGVSVARNRAIAAATSKWVAFLDQDDWYDPGKLAGHEASLKPGVVLSYSRACTVDNVHTHLPGNCPEPEVVKRQLRYRNMFAPGAVMLLRAAVVDAGGFNPAVKGCEDWELWVRLSGKGEFVYADKALYYILVHGENYSLKPAEMLNAVDQALPTLLHGTSGWTRAARRRRIMAEQYASAALMCRNIDERRALGFVLRSLGIWPYPGGPLNRYKLLAAQCWRAWNASVRQP